MAINGQGHNNSSVEEQNFSILVVEDDGDIRNILSLLLRRLSGEVQAAEHGKAALEILKQQDFDLILLDIMMPVMDGFTLLEIVKADSRLKDIPVLVLSGVEDQNSVVRCIHLGAEDYIPKPINRVVFNARITALLEKNRLRKNERDYELMKQELEIGRQIQTDFFPAELPRPPGWEVCVSFHPAREVSGDFYDVFTTRGGSRLAFVIADVCGKGVGAAMFMAVIRSLIRVLTEQVLKPEDFFNGVNYIHEYILFHHRSETSRMFSTLFLGLLNPESGELSYINAGHPPPLLFSEEGREELTRTGPAVGLMPGAKFRVAQTVMAPGDIFFTFTDGVSEAMNPAGELYETRRFNEILEKPAGTAEELLGRIETDLVDYTEGDTAMDDLTMLALRRCK